MRPKGEPCAKALRKDLSQERIGPSRREGEEREESESCKGRMGRTLEAVEEAMLKGDTEETT